jgi:hypothetical protein
LLIIEESLHLFKTEATIIGMYYCIMHFLRTFIICYSQANG